MLKIMYLDFNRIYLIESLNLQKDEATSHLLYYSLPNYDIDYIDIDTPKELFKALKKIEKDCETKGIKPIIDLSMHGIRNSGGLELWDGSIDYEELYRHLAQINIASGWNLFLVTSACYGMNIINTLSPSNPCPFNFLFASTGVNYQDDLFNGFFPFYSELCKTHDLQYALSLFRKRYTGTQNKFHCLGAEDVFKILLKRHFKESLSTVKRAVLLKEYAKRLGKGSVSFEDRFIFHYKELPERVQNTFRSQKQFFFMLDQFPQNNRFCDKLVPQFSLRKSANVTFKQIKRVI